jgi:hypothetical protein
MGVAWKNEINLGMEQLIAWQLLGWQELRLVSNHKREIPGFPLPALPRPISKLDNVDYKSQNAVLQMGLAWRFEPIKKMTPTLGLGIGGNYRFGAVQTFIFEEDDDDEHSRFSNQLSNGWAGFLGRIDTGLDWQVHRLWRIKFGASYARMLGQKLPDGNIDHWWSLDAGIFYRWR